MTRLSIGIIGCGAIAQIQHLPHLRELSDDFEIGGLADLSPKLLEVVGEEYGVPPERRFVDYHDLVHAPIDGVIVCPSGSHAAPSIAAAEAGKHVFVEKPMCTTVHEAEAMVEVLRRKGNPVGYFLFAGEQHGFRKAANIQRALEAELAFYAINVFKVGLTF